MGTSGSDAEDLSDLAHALPAEETQQDSLTILVIQDIEGFVQLGSDFLPDAGIFGGGRFHGGGLFFAGAASGFGAPDIYRNVNGGSMQPGNQARVAAESRVTLGETDENRLSHFFRQRFAGEASPRDRIDEVRVPAHQLREGVFLERTDIRRYGDKKLTSASRLFWFRTEPIQSDTGSSWFSSRTPFLPRRARP